MKRNPLSVLCLSSLLLYIDSSFAKVRIGGGFGRGPSFKVPPTNRGTGSTTNRGTGSTNTGLKSSHGSSSRGGYPKQSGGYPPPSGRPWYPEAGRSGSYGAYPRKNINHNPKNRVLSPRYGSSFGYGGYGMWGGSPYSQSVQAMGVYPSDESRRFGHRAAMAAAGGAMAGMALGYGLGRFPRPHFSFHSPREEYYYNHYMYRKYGVKSTDSNDYSRDYKYTQPAVTYDSFMESCMKRTDVLPVENQRPEQKAPAVTSALDTGSDTIKTKRSVAEDSSPAPAPSIHPFSPAHPCRGPRWCWNLTQLSSGKRWGTPWTGRQRIAGPAPAPSIHPSIFYRLSLTRSPVELEPIPAVFGRAAGYALDRLRSHRRATAPAPRGVNQPEANPMSPDVQGANDTGDNDTVSIVEIGYPALIEQMKARSCLEEYMVYMDKYLVRGGARRLDTSLQGLLALVTSALMMLLNSNMLVLLH